MNIDYSVLNEDIKWLHEAEQDCSAEEVATGLVENGCVDAAFGHLVFEANGDFQEGGLELDEAILNGLEAYVSTFIETL